MSIKNSHASLPIESVFDVEEEEKGREDDADSSEDGHQGKQSFAYHLCEELLHYYYPHN